MLKFINLSTQPSKLWSKEQIEAAEKFGTVKDWEFPEVPPNAGTETIYDMADFLAGRLIMANPEAVLIQGEITLTYAIVNELDRRNVDFHIFAATTEKVEKEITMEDGSTKKEVEDKFVRFREYC